jgi:hypothetical protein
MIGFVGLSPSAVAKPLPDRIGAPWRVTGQHFSSKKQRSLAPSSTRSASPIVLPRTCR